MDFYTENDIEKSLSNVYVPIIIKSFGEEDEDGNYIFETEASNENLDLQNQIIQQKALTDSKEYFLSNGVISDDHQHKRYDASGNVISDKTKIIGEPISVRTEGTRTFVKGKLYSYVEAAKPFIDLLKAHSSRVKASVGGIKPIVRKNKDGTETVTAFMWNDLALTCSPVNYTVGSAAFAKSMSNVDFCKALSAGYGTDAATMTGGRCLQKEDLEGGVVNNTPENILPNEISKTEENDIDAINELMAAIATGEIKTQQKMTSFLTERGYSEEKARASVREIISQGGHVIMAKSVLEQTKNLLKSLAGGSPSNADDGEEKNKKPGENVPPENNGGAGSDNGGEGGNGNGEGGAEPNNITKSLPEGCVDATDALAAILAEVKKSNDAVAALTKRMDGYEAQQEDVSKSILEVAGSVAQIANTPLPTKTATSIQKSDVGNGASANGSDNPLRPTVEDYQIVKSALNAAFKDRANTGLTLEKSEHLSSAFNKAVHGGKISREDFNEISGYVRKYKA